MRHRADKNGRGAHTFSSPPPNQPQQTWGPTGQGQHVAVQQHHAQPVPQQQQQQQYQQQVQSQHQQQQSPWGVVIMQGSPSPSIGQQQQLQQQQQQQQTWGAQHAQQHSASQLPQQGTTQFSLSVNQPQSYGAQGQQNHSGASNGQQHQLQGIYPVNPSQPQPHLQAWTAQPSSAQRTPSHYGSNHSQSMMSSNSGGGGGGSSSASSTMVLPWGQQPQTGGYSPTAPIVSSASGGSSWQGSSRPKFNSSTNSTKFNSSTSSTKFNSNTSSTSTGRSFDGGRNYDGGRSYDGGRNYDGGRSYDGGRNFDGGGGKSGHRSFYSGQRTRATPPPSPRADMAAGKRGRKRKPRAVTETMPANKRTPHPAKGGGGGSKGRQAASGKGGGGASSGGTGSQDAKAGDGVKILPCEPCEKEFTTELARIAHLDAHVRCEEPGCGFSALRKIVSLHHEVKHGQFSGSGFQEVDLEGQKFRVLLGGCPEEVEQWRAARKKLWPTNANIARKNEETKTRKQLGDPGPDPGQAGKGRGKDRGQGQGRGSGLGGGQAVPNPASADEAQDNADAEENAVVAVKRENGDVEGKTPAKVAKLSSEGGGEKASMDVDGLDEAGTGMEVKEELDAGADSEAAPRDRPKKLCSFYLRGTCGKGEACTFSHDVERKPCSYFMKGRCKWGNKCNFMHDPAARTQAKLEGRNAVEDAPGSSGKEKQAGKRVKAEREAMQRSQSKPTLLRKLLAPQLHRESSIALQAVRFIVGSNFFLDPAAASADGDPSSLTTADGAVAGESAKHDVEAEGAQSVASVKATGAAGTGGGAGTATESKETADATDAVGEKPDHMEEEDDSHPTVEPGSSPNGASAEVPTVDADASDECVDTTAVSPAAAATSTNGKPLGGDTKVEEGCPGDAVPASGEPVAAAGDQGGKATGINQSGEENSPRAVEEGSAASAVAPETAAAAALSSEADSCDTASAAAAAQSTDKVPPKGNLTPAVAPEIAAVAGTGSDTETDDTAATPNTNGLPPDGGKSRRNAKNDDVHQAVGKESAQSVAVAGATADTSDDSVAAAAGTKTGGLPEGGDQKA